MNKGGGALLFYNDFTVFYNCYTLKMKKNVMWWIFVFVFICIWPIFALTPKEQKWVKVLKWASLAYEQPDRATPFSLDQAPDTITYRKSILPYQEDQDADMYIVLPTLGIVAPIIILSEDSWDYQQMFAWNQININKYLIRWVLLHAGTWIPGEVWNPVIFGHSNFYKNKLGDYKTIFADIMNLDVGHHDEIWIFVKQKNGTYDLRKFSIQASYETVPEDIGVMKPQGGKEITVYACTNWLAWRWILKGKYREKNETLVPYPMIWEMDDMIEKLEELDEARRKDIIKIVLNKIESVRKHIVSWNLTYHDKFKKYLLNWIERKLIEVY